MNRSTLLRALGARSLLVALLSVSTVLMVACGPQYYKFPQYTFANRPIPPSKLANRVLVSITSGSSGALAILDGLRDIRGNVQNTTRFFSVSGYSSGFPSTIQSYPEQIRGFVYSDSDGSISNVNYGTESAAPVAGVTGTGAGAARSTSTFVSEDLSNIYATQESNGQLVVVNNNPAPAGTYALNLPNVYKVVSNTGNTVTLAMVRNSNALYRLVRLNTNQAPPPGSVDCQPYNLPVFCVVPVTGNFDRPVNAYFSVDGTTAYVLNCGPECGGATASVSVLQQAPLNLNTVPTAFPDTNATVTTVPVPGGATVALASESTLYVAGQHLVADGLLTGALSTLDLASNSVTGSYSISDGYHSKLLFADDDTLWIGSQRCATGERAKLGQNYNCLTRFDRGALTASVVPNVTPGGATTVPYPNENLNQYYYGDLTGLCWVQNLHKVYTAYGGQVHAFQTGDASEINNVNITVQGTALDVAYMDATTNTAN